MPVYVRTADKASLDVAGDIEISVRVAPNDWTPAAAQMLMAKWTTTSNQRAFYFAINTAGNLALVSTADGSTQRAQNSNAATGFTDGTDRWVNVRYDVDDGAGNRVATFRTAAGGSSDEPSSWSTLGTAVTTAGATSIFNSSSTLEVGSFLQGGGSTLAGKLYRAILRDGIGGTIAADFDARRLAGGTSYVDDYGNTWNVG